jgi:hypothetical protein
MNDLVGQLREYQARKHQDNPTGNGIEPFTSLWLSGGYRYSNGVSLSK